MQTETIIREGDTNLYITLVPSKIGDGHLSLEITNCLDHEEDHIVTVTVFTRDRVSFLEALKGAVDECLLRVRDEEQTGERDDA